jgi:hypothetical protein
MGNDVNINSANKVIGPSSGLSTLKSSASKTAEDNFLDVLRNTFAQEKGKLKEIQPGVYSPDSSGKGSVV